VESYLPALKENKKACVSARSKARERVKNLLCSSALAVESEVCRADKTGDKFLILFGYIEAMSVGEPVLLYRRGVRSVYRLATSGIVHIQGRSDFVGEIVLQCRARVPLS